MSVELLKTLAAVEHEIVFLDNGVTVALVTALKVFPFVGQAEAPVNVLEVNTCEKAF